MFEEESTITAQEGICLHLGMSADEEVGHDTVPISLAAYREAVLPPQLSGQFGGSVPHGFIDHPQRRESAPEGDLLRKVGTDFTPYDFASHKDARVVGLAKGFS